jgi:hypothetical protein
MFKKTNKLVQPGDQFVHLGDEIGTTWEVVSLVDNPHLPPHARIREAGKQETHLTSVSALLDEGFYKPTERKPVVAPEPVDIPEPIIASEPVITPEPAYIPEPVSTSEPQNSNDRITDLFGHQVKQMQGCP